MKKIIGLLFLSLMAGGAVGGDASMGKDKTMACAGCHGADGNSMMPVTPSLAGQNEKYLVKQLQDFKSGARQNAIMAPMANMLSDEDAGHVGAFFESQAVKLTPVEDQFIALGEKLYRAGDSDRNIPACMACHSANGKGMASAGFPSLSGQRADYTKAQLQAFRAGSRTNDANKIMRDVVAKMSDEQIEAISQYIAGLH